MIRLHSFEISIWQGIGSMCSCLLGISVILSCHIFRWEESYLIKLSALFLEKLKRTSIPQKDRQSARKPQSELCHTWKISNRCLQVLHASTHIVFPSTSGLVFLSLVLLVPSWPNQVNLWKILDCHCFQFKILKNLIPILLSHHLCWTRWSCTSLLQKAYTIETRIYKTSWRCSMQRRRRGCHRHWLIFLWNQISWR